MTLSPTEQPAAAAGHRPQEPSERSLAVLLLGGGLAGLAAASTLLVERLAMAADPDYVPTCSINPVISCGSVMTSEQAAAFGFPNPVLGVAGFAAVAAIGAGMLAGGRFRPWFWLGLQVGVTFGVVFVHWLIFQSLYRIGALCPWCMVVWSVTIPLFWYVTLHNLRRGVLPAPDRLKRLTVAFHGPLLTAWFLTVAGLIVIQFWTYWRTLL